MKYYLHRLKYNHKYKISFVIIFSLMTIDLLILNTQMTDFDPNHSTFLVGASGGHYAQMLILWLAPAYLILGEASWFLIDEKTKNSSILITKFGKTKYIKKYLINVLVSTFILFFSNLIINYVLAIIINNGGTVNYFMGNSNEYTGIGNLQFQLNNPILSNIIFIIITSLFISIYAMFISCLSFFFSKISYVFLLSFALWFVMISGKYSILLTFQPFAEYSFLYIGKIYFITICILLMICLILYIYKVKKDDL